VKLLVTGWREHADRELIYATLAKFRLYLERAKWCADPALPVRLVHGAAPGADRIAARIARGFGWAVQGYPADWAQYGLQAGPLRNKRMLNAEREGLDLCLAFPRPKGLMPPKAHSGTADMIRRCRLAGVPVLEVYR